MRDFMRLRILLSTLTNHAVKPHIVTVGILFNANNIGLHRDRTLETWRRMGILYRCMEMETDPLVLAAFEKGQLLRKCEEAYFSLEPIARQNVKGFDGKHGIAKDIAIFSIISLHQVLSAVYRHTDVTVKQ